MNFFLKESNREIGFFGIRSRLLGNLVSLFALPFALSPFLHHPSSGRWCFSWFDSPSMALSHLHHKSGFPTLFNPFVVYILPVPRKPPKFNFYFCSNLISISILILLLSLLNRLSFPPSFQNFPKNHHLLLNFHLNLLSQFHHLPSST